MESPSLGTTAKQELFTCFYLPESLTYLIGEVTVTLVNEVRWTPARYWHLTNPLLGHHAHGQNAQQKYRVTAA